MTRQEQNNKEVAKARETLKKIGSHIVDRCSYFYTYLDNMIEAISNAISANPDVDIQKYISEFNSVLNSLIEENMEYCFSRGIEREEEDTDKFSWLLPILILSKDYKKASEIYTDVLSKEIAFFRENGGYPYDLGLFIKEPIEYIASHKWDITKFKTDLPIKQGMSYSIEKVIPPLLMNTGIDVQNKTLQEIWRRRGVRYYQGFRNSDYHCPLCDELCAEPHPITDMVFPAHPRCVCGIVYLDDYEE